MVFIIKHKYKTLLFFLFVLNFAAQIRSDDNAPAGEESGSQGSNDLPVKAEKTNTHENEPSQSNSEDEKDNAKLEKSDQLEHKKVEIKSEHVNGEENDLESHLPNEKLQPEKEEGNEQPAAQEDKSEEAKQEAPNHDVAVASESKKQIQKNDANHKTELNDVNAYNGDRDNDKPAKREASFAYGEFLGLPRDANYFFDDLEPFFNNYTDTRVGRAAPTRDTKIQKTRLSAKVKDNMEEDAEEDDEDDVNDEEEKLNEEEYDDDEDSDSDCQPTTACSHTTTCPTTTTCATTTTEKSTTTPQCTTQEVKTKCPKICAKAVKRTTTPSTKGCDACWDDKKKIRGGKRRLHGQSH